MSEQGNEREDSAAVGAGEARGAAYEADPYEYGDARALMEELELAEPIAITLVRRGHRTPERARSFLAASVRHDPSEFDGIDEAVELIRLALEAGSRITVHGDYDVDGIAATAILVSALRRAGGDCDWLIPDRSSDGYGLSAATVTELAERGTELLITADCGITSAEEVALAAELGLETVVTDHHRPSDRLPNCPIVHPEVSGYPFSGLCGAAVARKLVDRLEEAGRGDEGGPGSRDLDLVALATIADMVPLLDENRTLAREGIAELRRARRPGIRALLDAAGVEPEHLDEGDIAFRIAPRINAAGRLYRADAGVELMITEDAERAVEIAAELNAANGERREVEREVSRAAAAALRELPDELRDAPGLVLAGEGWHPGVVGIAASRIVERTGRPAVLLSIGDDGRAKGSGRSIPGFDLLAALEECSGCLDRFGGHRAAAGVELDAGRIDDFRAAFVRAVAAQMPDGPPGPIERIDAVVGAEALDHRLAEQLDDLGPFGQGNPGVRLLVPWARVGDLRPMGEGGRHARFSVSSGPAKASGVAFNANGALGAAQRAPSDLTVRLELNRWNGAVEPRAVLESARPGQPGPGHDDDGGPGAPACACAWVPDPAGRWSELFEAELAAEPGSTARVVPIDPAGAPARRRLSHPRRSAVALIGELLSSGSRVLVLCADARRRAGLATLAASPGRFGGSHAVICGACPAEASDRACGDGGGSLVLSDWDAIAANPRMPNGFGHVVCVDPPPEIPVAELVGAGGEGYLHMALAGAGSLPERSWAERWQPRALLAEIYRSAMAEPGGIGEPALSGADGAGRDPVITARCVRVLAELGIAELSGNPGARTLRIVSSERTQLERSGAWRAYTARYEDGVEYLQSRKVS